MNIMLLNIGYSELEANWNWKKIYSPFARIYYVKGGEARTFINGEPHRLKPDHLYLTPPFTLHDDECDSFFSLYYIHFYENEPNRESFFDRYRFPVEIEATPLDLSLIRRLQEIHPDRFLRYIDPQVYDNLPTFSYYAADNQKMPLHLSEETQGILSQLMSRFLALRQDKMESSDPRISKCLRHIHENIGRNIRLEQLADISCTTTDHLIRLFKKEMGNTPLHYIITKKIEKAQLLLLTTDRAVHDIALDLSIDNISYFNRLFKAAIGLTPGEYRSANSKKYTPGY